MDKDEAKDFLSPTGLMKSGRRCVLLADHIALEIIDLIEQQAQQIQAMRRCGNCMRGSFIEECDICRTSDGFNYDRGWKWDGGNNE